MFHGSHNEIMGTEAAHVGMCLTDSIQAAMAYASAWGKVYEVEIELESLNVIDVDGYDRDLDFAPGDDGAEYGCDVIIFDDEDEMGRWHRTWRLVSQRAVDACTISLVRVMENCACTCGEAGCDLCCW